MGNPWYTDDNFQCFNPAKNFQLNWYDDAKTTEDPRTSGYSKTLTLVGIDEYNIRGDSPVTVRLETGTADGADYFVGFNRASATGPNRYNDQGDNQVNIIQVEKNNGVGYSQSWLRALLSQGQSYAISNFGGTGKTVTITVDSIDITSVPGTAVITIDDGTINSTPSPTNPPTPNPTPAPVPPTQPPTPVPTSPPTNNPTQAPVPPTAPPTPAPTYPPVYKYTCSKWKPADSTICAEGSTAGGECANVGTENSCGKGGKSCWWASCPGVPPTPPPSPSPGGDPICGATGEPCSGTCIDSGKPSRRGCFL